MSIPRILVRSLREGFLTKRFLPLFILYFLFLSILLAFIQPVLKVLPNLLSLEFTKFSLGIVGVSFATIFILFIIILLINLWFIGALTYQAYSNKSFRFSLKKSQDAYLKLLAFSFLIILIEFVTYPISAIGSIIRIIVDMVLFFALPGIVIMKYPFILSLKKSYKLFSKNILKTVVFWVSLLAVLILIFLALSFSVAATIAPILLRSLSSVSNVDVTSSDKLAWTQIVGIILENYPFLYLLAFIASYFLAGAYTFYIFARTYFYLELLKKKSNQ